ncbi:MAG: HlyD family efflux transporter periplasmic adaptor subunit [Deltaproteobacteria bacterium]
MRLNKRQSYIRVADERLPSVGNFKKNWGKFAYLAVSAFIIVAAASYLVIGFLYIEGTGQVIFDKLYIQHTKDIRLLKINVKEGDKVKKGDMLFTYREESDAVVRNTGSSSGDLEREMLKSEQGLRIKDLEISDLRERRKLLKDRHEKLKKEVALEAYLPDKLMPLEEDIMDINSSVKKAEEEAVAIKAYMASLKGLAFSRNGAVPVGNSGEMGFVAMEDGVVTRIYLSNHEVAMRGDTIMEIYKPEEISIKAFFPQEHINRLRAGLDVSIIFPEGTKSNGTIARYYFATQPLPPEFQKRFEPVTRNIAVDIVPTTQEDALMWKSFYKISVKVHVKRY